MKKPIYKKWWIWLIAFFAILVIFGAATGINQAQEDIEEAETEEKEDTQENEAEEETPTDLSREEEIQEVVQGILDEDIKNTEVREIKVNENLGLEDGSYIVLPHLTWEVSNKAKTTREMLEQYSDHLAAKLADETDISEVTIFWEVPYHLEDSNAAKFSYTREDDKMMVDEAWYDTVIKE